MPTLLASHGLFIVPLLFGLCFAGLAYTLLRALREGADSYAKEYAESTARQFEDLFLFIPARRIADIARVLAVTIFILFFLLFGDPSTGPGLLLGSITGLIGGSIALNAPRMMYRVLRARRLEKFNLQLVDALTAMSNSLRAGFSISQALESIVKEGQVPIAQEFSLFLQETRVGVRFEDALRRMEDRVGSEDLTLMIRAIETARITGGNLTEVFDQISSTIRERIRIQGRIQSLTSMGRMQAIVVGSIPLALFFAMLAIDPDMMKSFATSGVGIALLVLVLIFEALGAFVIKKIVTIDV